MSSIPIYIGFWHDYSRDGVLGWTLTLTVRWGNYLLAAMSTFVGFVGACFWDLVAFVIHQRRAKRGYEDGFYFQQQIIYRNPTSAWGTIIDLVNVCCAWMPGRSGRTPPRQFKRRSLYFSIPPLLVLVAFTAAGVLIGELGSPSYKSNDIKIKTSRCGLVVFNTTTQDGFRAELLNEVNGTLAARQYARNCYGSDPTLAECSLYPAQTLPYNASQVKCPFENDPKGHGLCIPNTALNADTGLLNSNTFLGINAAPQNQILFRKSVTCSPINANPYVEISQGTTGGANILTYYMGSVGATNYTYMYDTGARVGNFGYQLTPVLKLDGENGNWNPVAAMNIPNADISLFFLAPNSLAYLAPVKDPWFSAQTPFQISTSIFPNSPATAYESDNYVSVMGCIDQSQICNPLTAPYSCTILGSLNDMAVDRLHIGLNPYQMATSNRVIWGLMSSLTFGTVNHLTTGTLLANDFVVFGSFSYGLPPNQWQIEVQGWFETSLAKLQAFIVNWAANIADLGPYGNVSSPDPNLNPTGKAAYELCSNQRIRNTGSYQSFSALGLLIVICIGTLIIVLSLTAESCVASARRRKRQHGKGGADDDYREIARVADRKLQLLRLALMSTGVQATWSRTMDQIPITHEPSRFPLPTRTGNEEDFHYPHVEEGPTQQNCATPHTRSPAKTNAVSAVSSLDLERPDDDVQLSLMANHDQACEPGRSQDQHGSQSSGEKASRAATWPRVADKALSHEI